MIETESSSADSDDTNYDTMRLMVNKNPLIKLVTYGKIKKMVAGFGAKDLEPLERNLMRGVFIRKIRDFEEE